MVRHRRTRAAPGNRRILALDPERGRTPRPRFLPTLPRPAPHPRRPPHQTRALSSPTGCTSVAGRQASPRAQPPDPSPNATPTPKAPSSHPVRSTNPVPAAPTEGAARLRTLGMACCWPARAASTRTAGSSSRAARPAREASTEATQSSPRQARTRARPQTPAPHVPPDPSGPKRTAQSPRQRTQSRQARRSTASGSTSPSTGPCSPILWSTRPTAFASGLWFRPSGAMECSHGWSAARR